jgi:hypothetical protein
VERSHEAEIEEVIAHSKANDWMKEKMEKEAEEWK